MEGKMGLIVRCQLFILFSSNFHFNGFPFNKNMISPFMYIKHSINTIISVSFILANIILLIIIINFFIFLCKCDSDVRYPPMFIFLTLSH
ncbi:hypothetical protein VNO78_08292 [Psophocarpus tetragonolobus]|uniref:Uncharacterized protein n=1 Tax=Psophocarpus tetragonolobus TaxID=3891 RepID=A0AAN9SUP7_PSOTE